MPLVLTQNDATLSGLAYADVLGVTYEYPARYSKLIRPGEPFVYYRGRRSADGSVRPQVYLGTGVIGAVEASQDGLFRCDIEDYRPFPTPVPFKADGRYLEPEANNRSAVGFYYQVGVRQIGTDSFASIVRAGLEDLADPDGGEEGEKPPGGGGGMPVGGDAVDVVAMELAMERARSQWPSATAQAMPHNNPGFDVLVTHDDGRELFIEVKGTVRDDGRFFMSEGERRFAEEHAEQYELWVFHSLSVETSEDVLKWYFGSIRAQAILMTPKTWIGLPMGL